MYIFQSQYPPEQKPLVRIEPQIQDGKKVGDLVIPLTENGQIIPPEPPEKLYGKWNGIPLGGVYFEDKKRQTNWTPKFPKNPFGRPDPNKDRPSKKTGNNHTNGERIRKPR